MRIGTEPAIIYANICRFYMEIPDVINLIIIEANLTFSASMARNPISPFSYRIRPSSGRIRVPKMTLFAICFSEPGSRDSRIVFSQKMLPSGYRLISLIVETALGNVIFRKYIPVDNDGKDKNKGDDPSGTTLPDQRVCP